MRFIVDMNLSSEWTTTLHRAGHEAVHWSEIGVQGAPDEEILAYAREHGLIVFTHDLDFGTLLAHSNAEGPSVVQLREQDVDPRVIGLAVIRGLGQCQGFLEEGALVTIDLRRAKARILPIRRP